MLKRIILAVALIAAAASTASAQIQMRSVANGTDVFIMYDAFGGNYGITVQTLMNYIGGGGGSPGGSSGQVQYNNAGAFGGLTNTQLTALINPFTSALSGAVPASGADNTSGFYLGGDGAFHAVTSGGTVTSVGASVPTGLSVSGSPVTTSGTLALSWSGTIPNAQIPSPTVSTRGGVEAVTCTSGQFVNAVPTSGIPGCGTPPGGGNVSTSGTITSGDCAQFNSTTTVISTGVPCAGNSPGGSSGQVQYNNAGAFGGLTNTQLTALINPFTSTLSGVVPASGGNANTYLNGAGAFTTPPGGGNVSTSGTITSGNCAQFNSTTTVVSTGAPCGSGSGSGDVLTVYNVKNHGCVGNGVADDNACIISAMNAAMAAGGGIIFFPPGNYNVGVTSGMGLVIEIYSGTTSYNHLIFQGSGVGVTNIIPGNAGITIGMEMTGGFTNWDTMNTTYPATSAGLGSKTVTTTTPGNASNFAPGNLILVSGGLRGGTCTMCMLTDFWFPSWFTTVVSANASTGVITLAESIPMRGTDITTVQKIISMPNHLTFRDMTIGVPYTNSTISGCGLTDTWGVFGGDYITVENVETLPGCGPGGMFFDNVRHSGCRACVMQSGSGPIEFFGAADSWVVDSWLNGGPANETAVLLDGGSFDVTVMNNHFKDPSGNVISISDYTERAIVMGNAIIGLPDGGFYGVVDGSPPAGARPQKNNVIVGNTFTGIDTSSTIAMAVSDDSTVANTVTNVQLGIFGGSDGGGAISANTFDPTVSNPLQGGGQVGTTPYRFQEPPGVRTFPAGTATPNLPDAGYYLEFQSGAQNVTNFLGGQVGDEVTITFADSLTTLVNGNIILKGGTNYTPLGGGTNAITMKFVKGPSQWYEVSRTQ